MSREWNGIVSVIMTVYNTDKYLPLAIESILDQTFNEYEFIIIDDSSIDRSLEIIKGYGKKDSRIRLITNETNLGISRSRNIGLREAKGELIAVADSDDISLRDRLTKQVEYMNKHPETQVLGGQIEMIDSESYPVPCRWKFDRNVIRWNTLTKISAVSHPCMMAKKDYLLYLGGYPEGYKNSIDRALFQKMALDPRFCMRNLDDTILKYRVHSMGTSVKDRELQMKNSRAIRKGSLEILIGKELPADVFDVLFGSPPDYIPSKLSRKSFAFYEDALTSYKTRFTPREDEWNYVIKDFVKNSYNLLKTNPIRNTPLMMKLILYDPLFFYKKIYRCLKRQSQPQ